MSTGDIANGPLRLIRDAIGLTQVEVAAVAGVSPHTVRRIDACEERVRLGLIVKVAGAIGASVADLYPILRAEPTREASVPRRSRGRSAALRRDGAALHGSHGGPLPP